MTDFKVRGFETPVCTADSSENVVTCAMVVSEVVVNGLCVVDDSGFVHSVETYDKNSDEVWFALHCLLHERVAREVNDNDIEVAYDGDSRWLLLFDEYTSDGVCRECVDSSDQEHIGEMTEFDRLFLKKAVELFAEGWVE